MQKKVVSTQEPFLFLLAGAGSGKTRVVIERIKYLLDTGVKKTLILALTFTHKAGKEMQTRIGDENLAIHTFHQFCLQELKKNKRYDYNIFIEDEHHFTKAELLDIQVYKNSYFKTKKPKIYDSYQTYLNNYHLKDFDDILIDFYKLINTKNKTYTYDYIFVDEFQDTNHLQYMILKSLISKNTKVLCVGDPDQSIYRFRGAEPKIINQFIKDYQATVEMLTINYRSNATIIKHANRIIKRNYRNLKKDLLPFNKQTNQIYSYIFMHPEDESNTIENMIKSYIVDGIKPKEIAVLYRNNYRSYHLKNQFKINEFSYYDEANLMNQKQHIHMLTIHQAKGLEFEVVIILGLESSIFPSYQTHQKKFLEEERRLMFVAMTRAKEHLIFTHVRYNDYFKRQSPSLFIKETGIKSKVYKEIHMDY
ncbi:ATP-dependent helicase [Mariniplasma anaerobium]|nr:ATP-dependent helicase [Mariniplasma anaerobium]